MDDYDYTDIIKIKQDDGPNPVASIAYTAEYTHLMDIFRGIIAINEYSERSLALTQELLEHNAANYTIWQYRRDCLRNLHSNLDDELVYLDTFADENPKNYQIWHHRRVIIELSGNCSKEMRFTANVFEVDPKNYHAWSHRQWVIRTYDLWENELLFIDVLLYKDIRNNSAWNQRWFVVHHHDIRVCNGDESNILSILEKEVQYVHNSVSRIQYNESSWNYLKGLYTHHRSVLGDRIKGLLLDLNRIYPDNQYILNLLSDILIDEDNRSSIDGACALLSQLIVLDRIRAKWYQTKIDNLMNIA